MKIAEIHLIGGCFQVSHCLQRPNAPEDALPEARNDHGMATILRKIANDLDPYIADDPRPKASANA